MRYNRTDTALVRVIVPIIDKNEPVADKQISEFIKAFYPTLLQYLPA